MDSLKATILILGMAALSAGCGGGGSDGETGTGGTAGSGTAGSGGNGTAGSANGGTGGEGAGTSTGGTSTTGTGGTGGGGDLPPCGPDGSGVCVASAAPDCPIGYALTEMACDAAGGAAGSCCLPSGDTFSCGGKSCNVATQYCMVASGGPCCSEPAYTCMDLPQPCLAPGADCTCFDQADCPCGGGPGPCADGTGIEAMCSNSRGGLTFSCAYP